MQNKPEALHFSPASWMQAISTPRSPRSLCRHETCFKVVSKLTQLGNSLSRNTYLHAMQLVFLYTLRSVLLTSLYLCCSIMTFLEILCFQEKKVHAICQHLCQNGGGYRTMACRCINYLWKDLGTGHWSCFQRREMNGWRQEEERLFTVYPFVCEYVTQQSIKLKSK